MVDMLMWMRCFGHHDCMELKLHIDESLHINELHQTEQIPEVLSLQQRELDQVGNVLLEEDGSRSPESGFKMQSNLSSNLSDIAF